MSRTVDEKDNKKDKRALQRKQGESEQSGKSMAPPPFSLTSEPVQRKELGGENEPTQLKAESSGKSGLPGDVQGKMESSLGADFSNVNIHTNSSSATNLGAQAYTQGNDVHFAPGKFNPQSQQGQELIGHELTHVVQQREGKVQPTTEVNGAAVNDNKGLEKEADEKGAMAAKGSVSQRKVNSMGGEMTNTVQRKENTTENVNIQAGELTRLGEGSGAATRYIHWPETSSSGVTLGQGYDIGSRTAAQVIQELTAAGMSQEQATKISAGAGLKGSAAGTFCTNNKSDVGEIPVSVQNTLLSTMLVEYTDKAHYNATSTTADGNGVNARSREVKEGVAEGTYVLSEAQWSNLHPAMIELLTDLRYQGGFYGYDRVAKINEKLIANDGNHLEQFKAVRELFTGDYMDDYAGRIGMGTSREGAKETFFGQEMDLGGEIRRNQIRLAYLNKVISALEAGQTVSISTGATSEQTSGDSGQTTTTPQLENADASQVQEVQEQNTTTQQYTVQSGESLWVLSQKFNVSIDDIKAWNSDKLKTWGNVQGFNAGESIVIHTNATSTATTEPAAQSAPAAQETTTTTTTQDSGGGSAAAPGLNYEGLAETVYKAFFGGAFFGLGTDEQAAYGALSQLNRDSSKISAFMDAYRTKYGRDLVADIRAEFSNSWFGNDLDKALGYLNMGPLAQQIKKEATGGDTREATTTTTTTSSGPSQQERTAETTPKTEGQRPEGDYSRFAYDSQRDNDYSKSNNFSQYTKKISGDNMCNVTTLAMQLRSMATDDAQLNAAAADILLDKGYSGTKEALVQEQLEDLIMKIFVQLGDKYFEDNAGVPIGSSYGPHQYAGGLNHVAAMFDEYVGRAQHYGAATNGTSGVVDQNAFTNDLKPALDKGGSVMLSTKLTAGHIIMLVDVLSDGILVNDPYGMRMPGGYVKNGEQVKWRTGRINDAGDTYTSRLKKNDSLKTEVDGLVAEPGEKSFGHNLGELNFFSWDEVSTYKIGKWVNILHAKENS